MQESWGESYEPTLCNNIRYFSIKNIRVKYTPTIFAELILYI